MDWESLLTQWWPQATKHGDSTRQVGLTPPVQGSSMVRRCLRNHGDLGLLHGYSLRDGPRVPTRTRDGCLQSCHCGVLPAITTQTYSRCSGVDASEGRQRSLLAYTAGRPQGISRP